MCPQTAQPKLFPMRNYETPDLKRHTSPLNPYVTGPFCPDSIQTPMVDNPLATLSRDELVT